MGQEDFSKPLNGIVVCDILGGPAALEEAKETFTLECL